MFKSLIEAFFTLVKDLAQESSFLPIVGIQRVNDSFRGATECRGESQEPGCGAGAGHPGGGEGPGSLTDGFLFIKWG